jgi:HEAT repeat protein
MRIGTLRLLLFVVLVSAVPRDRTCVAQAPPTIEAELSKYGVPVTQLGLQSALKDHRPQVRGLAASKLAAMKFTASVPLIVKALEGEKYPLVKFNMAAALVSLNSQVGNRALLHICDEASLPEGLRLDAASRLIDVGDYGCLPSVDNILRKATDPSIKTAALLDLARVKVIPAAVAPRIHNTLLASLQDPVSAVRQFASECIATLGDKAAAPNLQTAIANESDEMTRAHMEESLRALESQSSEGPLNRN